MTYIKLDIFSTQLNPFMSSIICRKQLNNRSIDPNLTDSISNVQLGRRSSYKWIDYCQVFEYFMDVIFFSHLVTYSSIKLYSSNYWHTNYCIFFMKDFKIDLKLVVLLGSTYVTKYKFGKWHSGYICKGKCALLWD